MQVQFTRSTKTTQGMLKKKEEYQLTVLIQPTPEEDMLLTRHGLWSWTVEVENWQPNEKTTQHWITLSDMRQGTSFVSQRPQSILDAEKATVERIKSAIRSGHGLETFNGEKRIVEVTEDASEVIHIG